MPNNLLAILAAENKALRESRQAVPVREQVLIPAGAITRQDVKEASGSVSSTYKVAKVGQADTMNQNRRVYPKAEWALNIEKANHTLIPQGKLTGAVDHIGRLDGGNLKDSPILWKHLVMHEDGGVDGEFLIIEGHSRGQDLKAQLDAGMAIGFSTFGYAMGREPSEAERKQYGIPEDEENAVIIQNWSLKKIDAVDDPSVHDAWSKDSHKPAAARTAESATGGVTLETDMQTLDDLKAQHPQLFALHEKAIAEAVAAVQGKLDEQIQKTAGLEAKVTELTEVSVKAEALKGYLAGAVVTLGEVHAIEIPFREIAEKEAAEKIEALTQAGAVKDSEIADLKARIEQVEQEKTAAAEITQNEQRKSAVKAKASQLLKDSRFAAHINALVEKQVETKTFDLPALEALVKEKTEEYEAVAAAQVSRPEFEITGITGLNDEDKAEDIEALPIAQEMADLL